MSELQQLQGQMQVVIGTMKTLSETTDTTLGRIAELEDLRKAVYDMKMQMDQQGQAGAFGPRQDAGRRESDQPLINPKDMKVREFDGDKGFTAFIEDTKAYFEVVRPNLAKTIEWIEYQPGVLERAEGQLGGEHEILRGCCMPGSGTSSEEQQGPG